GIGKKHFQAYLDEFCYRFNRRNWEQQLFDRLVTACVNSKGICYAELTQ
ncbi:MAG: IS1595 family transposase, partial [Deltaproteobacteria bacterium]|nr:IS1595 family transposase [Deltaproteobacteria bacterium]